MSFKPCALVPVYNHHLHLPVLIAALRAHGLNCILVDDGSDAATKKVLQQVVSEHTDVECVTLAVNSGKGAAVIAGIRRAAQRGYSHALQVDADGQHDLGDVPAMLKLASENPQALISGTPRYDASVPKVRFYGRYLTHVWVWIETLSTRLKDSMCGFRVYPVDATLALAERVHLGRRMDFDTDVMVRLYWAGVDSLFLPTRVRYPADGISHFQPFGDNLRITWMHTRLACGMLWRAPMLLSRRWRNRRQHHWAEINERGTLFGMHILTLTYRLLGRRASHLLLLPIVAYFFFTHGQARRASREYLQTVAPRSRGQAARDARPGWRSEFRHFLGFATANLDKVIAWRDPQAIPVRFPADTALRASLESGQGALMLSAHMGSVELARAFTNLMPQVRVNALVYTQHVAKFNSMLDRANDAYRMRLIHVQEIDPGTGMRLREKITAGELLVMVGDRTPVSVQSPVVKANFLGRPAPFAIGPYVLAHILECPIYLFFCMAERDGYTMYLERFADRIRLPRRGREAALREWAQRYADRLEDYATRFPLQWYNFFDFWAERPGAPAYATSHPQPDKHGQESKTTA